MKQIGRRGFVAALALLAPATVQAQTSKIPGGPTGEAALLARIAALEAKLAALIDERQHEVCLRKIARQLRREGAR